MLFELQRSNEIGIFGLAGKDFEGDDFGMFEGTIRMFG
jgi:hypothetical protein